MVSSILHGKKILITAGPTREAIDPVRYISNHSSGKMGYAIAEALLQRGADVILVSGPVGLELINPRLKLIQVESASAMYSACRPYFEQTEIAIFAAAVADYRPAVIAQQKLKKNSKSFFIEMTRNIDIAREFGLVKRDDQLSVGFALETNDEISNVLGKLKKKNFDLIVLNSMNDANATFGHDTNKITLIKNDFSQVTYALKNKKEVADDIVDAIATMRRITRVSSPV